MSTDDVDSTDRRGERWGPLGEAARALSLSEKGTAKLVKLGKIRSRRLPGLRVQFSVTDAERLAAAAR